MWAWGVLLPPWENARRLSSQGLLQDSTAALTLRPWPCHAQREGLHNTGELKGENISFGTVFGVGRSTADLVVMGALYITVVQEASHSVQSLDGSDFLLPGSLLPK